jgi:3-oxoacyl-[acyl-carrier-protein] synthase III
MTPPKPVVEIASTGRWLPDRVMTNADLEQMLDTSDEWIRERTGIRERRIADPGIGAAEMGRAAAQVALERAGMEAGELDLVVLSTATPDRLLPSTGCEMQALLGARKAAAFDISAACSGFVYGMSIAEDYIRAGRGETALVVATEKMSAIVDWEDRATAVLFGDGAGATLAELLWRPHGGALRPMDAAVLEERGHLVQMAGREVFKAAVRSMADAADQALARAGLTGADIDLLVPHQANMRIIESTAKYACIPMDRVFVNVDRYGNMSSATIPVALDEAVEQGRIGPGANILIVAFGAGFTWGSMVVRW